MPAEIGAIRAIPSGTVIALAVASSRMEEAFDALARGAGSIVEAVAVLTVFYGSVEAFINLVRVAARPAASHGERKAIWRRFGVWLLLGLEFELAADIIGSVVSPTWQEVGKLGAIAVIRTFLNYFLEKDLDGAEASGGSAGQRE